MFLTLPLEENHCFIWHIRSLDRIQESRSLSNLWVSTNLKYPIHPRINVSSSFSFHSSGSLRCPLVNCRIRNLKRFMVSLLHLILGVFQPMKEYPSKDERVASPTLLFSLFTFNFSFVSMNLLMLANTRRPASSDLTWIWSRVAQGTLTLRLSQNRTWTSPLIRLLSSSRRKNSQTLPVGEKVFLAIRDPPNPMSCFPLMSFQLLIFPHRPPC